ncbi:MAG: hypothetical protein HGA36_01895 [Candidatus Moranbacteria bacterium]|nr:hypothetical protein [Candidatus Moranbacteria bacterium]
MKVHIRPLVIDLTMTAFSLAALNDYLHISGEKVDEELGFSIETNNAKEDDGIYSLAITINCVDDDIDNFVKIQQRLASLIDRIDEAVSAAREILKKI